MRLVLQTGGNGTILIGASFVFIAYFLHPIVEHALHRVRAYRAWRAIERKEMVEVTSYPFAAEVLYGRGKWDAARMIALLLACFSVASWGLELSLKLATVNSGPVDMMDRPPPVYVQGSTDVEGRESWLVQDNFEIESIGKLGTLDNIDNTLENGSAESRYRIGDSKFIGSILTAWWSGDASDSESSLAYNVNGTGVAMLTTLNCTRSLKAGTVYIDSSGESWGSMAECETGPAIGSKAAPPVILLEAPEEGTVYMIVEEDSNYPSFLYSVWKTVDGEVRQLGDSRVTVHHLFHIASRSRLVEAIITGIVLGAKTGGQCVDLLYQFSQANAFYPGVMLERASPFGEHPGNSTAVKDLSDVEPIEDGVNMDVRASTCFLWILIVSVLGIGWSTCLRSRIGMDIYNRDELIRAVSLPDQHERDASLLAMRMFVHKNDTGAISVVIEESDGKHGGLRWWDSLKSQARCLGVRSKLIWPGGSTVTDEIGGTEVAGERIPERPRQVTLEGWRLGTSRQFPRSHGPWAVNLAASPISSLASTPSQASPIPGRLRKEMNPTMAEYARNELDRHESSVSRMHDGSVFFTGRSSNASVGITSSGQHGVNGTPALPGAIPGRTPTGIHPTVGRPGTTATTPGRSRMMTAPGQLGIIPTPGTLPGTTPGTTPGPLRQMPTPGRSGKVATPGRSGAATATPARSGSKLKRLTSRESEGSHAAHPSSDTTTTPSSASRTRFLMRSTRTLVAESFTSPKTSWAEPDASFVEKGNHEPFPGEVQYVGDPME